MFELLLLDRPRKPAAAEEDIFGIWDRVTSILCRRDIQRRGSVLIVVVNQGSSNCTVRLMMRDGRESRITHEGPQRACGNKGFDAQMIVDSVQNRHVVGGE